MLGIVGERAQIRAARKIVSKGLSVREAEKLAKGARPPLKGHVKSSVKEGKDPNIRALEQKLIKNLGTKVRLKHKGKKGGVLEIEYYSLEELDRIVELLL